MNRTAEPCGPCAAVDAASVLWQSEQVMVWLPGLVAQGARSCDATWPFAVEPVWFASVFTIGWTDLLLTFHSCARSVSASVDGPVGGVVPKAQPVWHLKHTWYSAVARVTLARFVDGIAAQFAGIVPVYPTPEAP